MSINSIGFDINQPLASKYPRTAYETPPPYFTGIVEDIILNETGGKYLKYQTDGSNIGLILVRVLPMDRNVPIEKLRKAFPLESNIQSYPLKGEQVLLFKAMGALYYTRPVATTRKVTENLWSSVRQQFRKKNTELEKDARGLSTTGAAVGAEFQTISDDDLTAGNEFVRNPTVRSVRANEGDIILQGRYGNVIRMGSTLVSNPTQFPDANMLLSVGLAENPSQVSTTRAGDYSLVYENLDTNKSSIWMVANQEIKFTAATQRSIKTPQAHLLTSPTKVATYDGAQIIINSDRVLLNSKQNEISLFSNKEINLCALGAVSVNTENDIFLRSFSNTKVVADISISLDAPDITISAKNLSYEVSGDYIIKGNRVFIGRYATTGQEPLVLGNKLAAFLFNLTTQVNLLTTVVTQLAAPGVYTAVIPPTGATPPIPLPVTPTPAVSAILAQASAISTQLIDLSSGTIPTQAIFNSVDNFTFETNT